MPSGSIIELILRAARRRRALVNFAKSRLHIGVLPQALGLVFDLLVASAAVTGAQHVSDGPPINRTSLNFTRISSNGRAIDSTGTPNAPRGLPSLRSKHAGCVERA